MDRKTDDSVDLLRKYFGNPVNHTLKYSCKRAIFPASMPVKMCVQIYQEKRISGRSRTNKHRGFETGGGIIHTQIYLFSRQVLEHPVRIFVEDR